LPREPNVRDSIRSRRRSREPGAAAMSAQQGRARRDVR
jgi:hypothetical protein